MITTKYCPGNVALLLIAIVVALADGWVAMMTAGFGTDPVHDVKSGVFMVVLWASLALLPACLITLIWPKVGAMISWSVVALCCLSFWASPAVIIFLILAAIEGLIGTGVASHSKKTVPLTVIAK